MKWKPITTFNKKIKKPVLILIEASDNTFPALAIYRKRADNFNWYICDALGGDGGPWHIKCVNWWYPVEMPRGYEK